MALTDRADLLFKISADSKDASEKFKALKGDVKDLKNETDGAGTGFEKFAAGAGLSASQLNVLSTIATTAVAGITAMAAATVSASVALFRMAQTAAEFGSQIFDASEKTGLAAKTLSAMKVAADQSGSSFEAVTDAVSKFSVLVGQAVEGSDKAVATLAKFGLEPVKAANDLEAALADAIKQIAAMGTEAQQNAALVELFGRAGKDLLPFIKSFDGDLEGLIRRMEELGLTIDDNAARAADEFGDTLDTLTAQTTAFTRSFANEFVPELTRGMNRISSEFSENKDVAAEWGRVVGEIIRGLTVVAESDFGNLIATFANGTAQIIRYTLPLIQILDTLRSIGAADGQALGRAGGSLSPALTGGFGGVTTGGGGGGGRGGGGGASSAQREAEQAAARDLRAQLEIEQANFRTIRENLSKELETLMADFELSGDRRTFIDGYNETIKRFQSNLEASLDLIDELERRQLRADAGENERAALQQKQTDRRNEIEEQFEKKRQDAAKAVKAEEEDLFKWRMKAADERFDKMQKEFKLQQQQTEEEKKRTEEFNKRTKEIAFGEGAPEAVFTPTFGGGFADAIGLDEESLSTIEERAKYLQGIFSEMGGIIGGIVQNLAQGIGSMVQAWVLYGTAGPNALRKMLAAVLAAAAAEAAMRAIMEAAKGFARLAVGDSPGAALHFKAAALFGAIAGGAAIAGRAVAGDSFSQGAAGGGSSRFAGAAEERELNNDYRSRFQGFGGEAGQSPFAAPLNAIKDRLDRQEAVLGGLFETNRLLSVRLTSMRPGDVLAIGADENPSAIRKSIESELGTELRASETMFRLQGAYD